MSPRAVDAAARAAVLTGDADGSSPTQLDASAELHQLRRAVLDGRVLSGEEATRALDIARSVVSPAPGCATED